MDPKELRAAVEAILFVATEPVKASDLAEALEIPVAHTLMGKGCMHEDHPLLLGMTGFWGTPIEIGRASCRERVCQYV